MGDTCDECGITLEDAEDEGIRLHDCNYGYTVCTHCYNDDALWDD